MVGAEQGQWWLVGLVLGLFQLVDEPVGVQQQDE